ncbi:MAG: hypothetical protein IPP35_12625 [Elusimicrobia bacterium]|nr:hypothetical protein [Elusimicrobiota bacterium]
MQRWIQAVQRGPASTFDFDLAIGTGSYWVNVQSKYWGVVREGGGQGQLVVTEGLIGAIPLNFKFAKAGRIKGFLYKPDGSLYTPGMGSGASINAGMKSGNGWGYGNISRDGSYVIGGLLPGTYQIRANGWGDFDLANPIEQVTVNVVAEQDAYVEVHTVNGTKVLPRVNLGLWTPTFPLGRPSPDKDGPFEPSSSRRVETGPETVGPHDGGDQPNGLLPGVGRQWPMDPDMRGSALATLNRQAVISISSAMRSFSPERPPTNSYPLFVAKKRDRF